MQLIVVVILNRTLVIQHGKVFFSARLGMTKNMIFGIVQGTYEKTTEKNHQCLVRNSVQKRVQY